MSTSDTAASSHRPTTTVYPQAGSPRGPGVFDSQHQPKLNQKDVGYLFKPVTTMDAILEAILDLTAQGRRQEEEQQRTNQLLSQLIEDEQVECEPDPPYAPVKFSPEITATMDQALKERIAEMVEPSSIKRENAIENFFNNTRAVETEKEYCGGYELLEQPFESEE